MYPIDTCSDPSRQYQPTLLEHAFLFLSEGNEKSTDFASEGDHVMFAKTEDINVTHDDHFIVIFFEYSVVYNV
jgi:hypothetical protein